MSKKPIIPDDNLIQARKLIIDLIEENAHENSIEFLLRTIDNDIKGLRKQGKYRKDGVLAQLDAALVMIRDSIIPLIGKYDTVPNPYDEGLAVYNLLAGLRKEELENYASREFHYVNRSPGVPVREKQEDIGSVRIILISQMMNNLHRQMDKMCALHAMNITLGFYDDMQNNKVTARFSGGAFDMCENKNQED